MEHITDKHSHLFEGWADKWKEQVPSKLWPDLLKLREGIPLRLDVEVDSDEHQVGGES